MALRGAAAAAGVALGSAIAQLAHAQEAPTGMVVVGAAAAPDYMGSSDYALLPFGAAEVNWRDVSLALRGPSARLGFSPVDGLTFGPALRYRGGRDDDVENDAVARLREVDAAVEAGGFVSYERPVGWLRADAAGLSLDLLADLGGAHDGVVGSLEASYGFSLADRWRLGFDAGLTVADASFAETYFAIDAADAARSGLRRFDAGAGLQDVSLGLSLTYMFDDDWGVLTRAGYTRLVGDAADSPIVEDEGSPDQLFVGVGLAYRF